MSNNPNYQRHPVTGVGGDILAWTRGAISHTERAAQTAASEGSPQWRIDDVLYAVRDAQQGLVVRTREDREASVSHIALHDPELVLRRCAADRQLLDLHGGRMHSCPAKDETGYLDEWTEFSHGEACPVVQNLAEVYGWTDHTDSRRTEGAQAPPSDGDQMT
ncbi:DUF6221 family protein [Streptomyces nigrescens]|uniref:DUF6221 family protein n=1 Tax=Streptomyces nigrescens TaxID=1920 RepID=UPI00368DB3E4